MEFFFFRYAISSILWGARGPTLFTLSFAFFTCFFLEIVLVAGFSSFLEIVWGAGLLMPRPRIHCVWHSMA